MSDLLIFCKDLYNSYLNLCFGSKLVLAGAATLAALKIIGSPLTLFVVRITKPLRSRNDHQFVNGVIYLHIFPREISIQTPNLSPYAIKLESWLRLKKIQYEVVETVKMSKSTKQIPYVVYNGQEYADSNLIMEFITEKNNLDTSEGLNPGQRAVARSLAVMMDESLSWSYFMYRYYYKYDEYAGKIMKLSSSWLINKMINRKFPNMFLARAQAQGIGRKDKGSVFDIGFKDIKAVSDFLGEKQFMMGDNITSVDCCVFGHLSQIVYVDFPYPHKGYIQENCENLRPYMDRIKAKLWPDWNTLVKQSYS